MAAPCQIRPARRDDVAMMAAIEHAVFTDPWSLAALQGTVDGTATRGLVAEVEGEVAGYVVIQMVMDEAEIQNLAVAPGRRRQGIAKALVRRALEESAAGGASRVFLDVRESNEAARRLYAGLGFTPVARRRDYYRRPREDAIVLMQEIAPDRVSSIDKRT